MTLAIAIGAAALISIFGLLGALRDLPRGIVVFASVVFGALLVDFWAAPLARDMSQRIGNPDVALLQRFSSAMLFSTVILVIGFGSGLLLPIIRGSTWPTRLAGAVIGLFSGAVAAGFLLKYTSFENGPFFSQIQTSQVGQFLLNQLPVLLAAGAGLVGIAVIIVGIIRVFGRQATAPVPKQVSPVPKQVPPAPKQVPLGPAPQPPSPRQTDKTVQDKIKERPS